LHWPEAYAQFFENSLPIVHSAVRGTLCFASSCCRATTRLSRSRSRSHGRLCVRLSRRLGVVYCSSKFLYCSHAAMRRVQLSLHQLALKRSLGFARTDEDDEGQGRRGATEDDADDAMDEDAKLNGNGSIARRVRRNRAVLKLAMDSG